MSHDSLKRLLALQTLIKVSDREGATIGDVIRGISTQTSVRRLRSLGVELKAHLHDDDPLAKQLVWRASREALVVVNEGTEDETTDHSVDDMVREGEDDVSSEKKITPAHVRGEAYEILCAILFRCKMANDFLLLDYMSNARTSGDQEDDRAQHRVCRVKAVLMSERQFVVSDDTLGWIDNREAWGADGERYLEGWSGYLSRRTEGHPAAEGLIAAFVEALGRYIRHDQGFDILTDLEEVDGGDRHLILVQCKYRSDPTAEVDMAPYVGKYHDVCFIVDRLNALTPQKSPMLMPMFWMSTVLEADSMRYFSNLRTAGKIFFYGNTAFGLDAGIVNLVSNVSSFCRNWVGAFRNRREGGAKPELAGFTHRERRTPRPHQVEAIEAVHRHCREGSIMQDGIPPASVIMATGSGKTLTALLAMRRLEEATDIRIPERHGLGPSLILSPLSRLCIQSSHDMMAEELAIDKGSFNKIYYCVCSMQREATVWTVSSGCSLRIIPLADMPATVRHHRLKGTLHRCRFFTTYQAGEGLRNMCRQINLADGRLPSSPIFGIKLLDEAHWAVGKATKSHGAGLSIPSRITLSFTATARYCWYHLTKVFPSRFSAEALEQQKQRKDNYLGLDSDFVFPQVDADAIAAAGIDPSELYCDMQWEAMDVLDSDCLWCEADSEPGGATLQGTGERTFDWRFFQNAADVDESSIVVFFVEDTPVNDSILFRGKACYDTALVNNRPAYFGVIPHGTSTFAVSHATRAWGVNKAMNKLFEPASFNQDTRGLSLNDMSGIGRHNRIGSVVHALTYKQCFDQGILVRPSLITLGTKPLRDTDGYRRCLDEVFSSGGTILDPSKVELSLTIGGQARSARAHHFRAMKLLFDVLVEHEDVHKVLVFCSNTLESKRCEKILDALLSAGRQLVHTDILYSSESVDGEIIDIMPYEQQQMKLDRFCEPGKRVLFNVKLISIGVDLPAIDCVMLLNPSKSQADITQKIGRCLRVDPNNTSKSSTVIVPMWADDLVDEPSLPTAPGAIDTMWRAPCRRSFEDSFLLIKRVLDAMDDDDVKMISSFSASLNPMPASSVRQNGPEKPKAEKSGWIKQLINDLRGASLPNACPVFDESFSKLVLGVWRPLNAPVGPSAPTRVVIGQDTSKGDASDNIFVFVAFVAFCFHKHGQIRDPGGEVKSFVWYPAKHPFDDSRPVYIKFDEQHEHFEAVLDLLGLVSEGGCSGSQLLMDAVRPIGKGGERGHRNCESLLKSWSERSEAEKLAHVDGFLGRLKRDIDGDTNSHAHIIRCLCDSSQALTGCDDRHGSHTLSDFLVDGDPFDFENHFASDFREFVSSPSWLGADKRRLPKTPNSKTSTGGLGSKSSNKRQRSSQDVEADFGSLTLDPAEGDSKDMPGCARALGFED